MKTTNQIIREYVERKDLNGLAEYFGAYIIDEFIENEKTPTKKEYRKKLKQLQKKLIKSQNEVYRLSEIIKFTIEMNKIK